MTQDLLPPSSGSCPAPDDAVERGARAITLPILAVVAGMLGSIALLIGLVARLEPARERPLPTVLVERGGRGAELPALTYSPMAAAITPITSLTASRPTELGGSTSGSLYASADRIDIYARTSSSTATLNLVEYLPDDGKWVKHGADCAVTTDLTLCRYVAKRGARYWHVYKASGSMAYVGIEQAYNQGASLGSIEPSGPGISLPLGVSDGGTGLASYTAGDLLYATGSATLAKLAKGSDGTYLTVQSGALAWGSVSAGGLGWYGDGSDGDVTISGGTTTLSREMVYNNLTVTSTGVLDMNGWPIRVLGTLTVQASGRVHCDGYAGSGSTGGAARPDNYLGGSTAGSNGSSTNAFTASPITNSAGGGAGGTGGSGFGGAYHGGGGGTRSLLAAGYGAYRSFPLAIQQYAYNGATLGTALLRGGTGGGGGAGNGGSTGGGGGGGGGRAIIFAYNVVNNGTISCNGAAGVYSLGLNTGGGGGGGGGSITVAYRTYSGSDPTASGGAGGTGSGNGTDGAAGAAGLVLKLQL